MKLRSRLAVGVTTLVVVVLVVPLLVLAQAQSSPSTEVSSSEGTQSSQVTEVTEGTESVTVPVERLVVETQANQQQLEELRDYYGDIVLQYRNQERVALIAQNQYEQLVTLSALEEAVVSTKTAMISRDEVLATYVSLLFFELRDTVGVNIVQKSEILTQLEQDFKDLKRHKEIAETATTREDIADLNEAFAILGPRVQDTTKKAVTLITVGRLQTVSDKGIVLTSQIETALSNASLPPAELSKQQRALQVTQQLNEQIKEEFRELYQQLSGTADSSRWGNVQEDVSVIYADLNQLLSYLKELSRSL